MKIILFLSLIVMLFSACSTNRYEMQHSSENSVRTLQKEEKEVAVGEASTKILDTGINRVSNIALACSSISGYVFYPNEEFSFNKTVGKRSNERGYKDAPILFHGEKSYGVGGGVCQVSSTLYMAAVNSGLEITERHPHSESVSYAPGTDATVVYGEKDLKFKNNTRDTLYIYVWIENENVYSKIVKKEL